MGYTGRFPRHHWRQTTTIHVNVFVSCVMCHVGDGDGDGDGCLISGTIVLVNVPTCDTDYDDWNLDQNSDDQMSDH